MGVCLWWCACEGVLREDVLVRVCLVWDWEYGSVMHSNLQLHIVRHVSRNSVNTRVFIYCS